MVPSDYHVVSLEAPVFIVGSGRCGSTLLVETLGSHPHVATLYELHSLILWLARLRRGEWPPEPMALQVDAENVREAADMGYNWTLSVPEADRLRARLSDVELSPEQAIRIWADAYHILNKSSGNKRVIHKTPGLASYVSELRKVWPQCSIVHILRHPCAVISSYLSANWGPTSVEEGINWYVERVRPAMVEGPLAPGYHEVVYEELLETPDEILDALTAELAIGAEKSHRWSIDPKRGRIDAWRDLLEPADAQRIEERVACALPRWPSSWESSASLMPLSAARVD